MRRLIHVFSCAIGCDHVPAAYHAYMDSVTQILLGAAVGEAVAGRRVGRRALLWGGLLGGLPDLDILISYGDVVKDVTYHRSWSHSILVMAALTPVLVWLILRIHPATRAHRRQWWWLVFLALATHTLLDCFTVFGTQILWPIPMPPVCWSTIFIIDPIFSLPLLVGTLAALILHGRRAKWATRLNAVGLALSCVYLSWTVGAKLVVEHAVREKLATQNIAAARILTTPAPFNSFLWRVVVMLPDDRYLEGYYSIASDGPQPGFTQHRSDAAALAGIGDEWPVKRLQWFTRGFYSSSVQQSELVITDLRMGTEPDYVFRFAVGRVTDGQVRSLKPRRLALDSYDMKQKLIWTWRRIWSTSPDRARFQRFPPALAQDLRFGSAS